MMQPRWVQVQHRCFPWTCVVVAVVDAPAPPHSSSTHPRLTAKHCVRKKPFQSLNRKMDGMADLGEHRRSKYVVDHRRIFRTISLRVLTVQDDFPTNDHSSLLIPLLIAPYLSIASYVDGISNAVHTVPIHLIDPYSHPRHTVVYSRMVGQRIVSRQY